MVSVELLTDEEMYEAAHSGGDCLGSTCPKCKKYYEHPDCECGYVAGQDAGFTLAECKHGVSSAVLQPWDADTPSLVKRLSIPTIGTKDGSYFLRCNGTQRNNARTDDLASILILDGDSRIDENGEVMSGAPDPAKVSEVLTRLGASHLIYSSYSNGSSLEEITAKGYDSGGAYGVNFHKYRAVIPCQYSREQLTVLLEYLFWELKESGVMLAPVKENKVWAQPWYFPRVPDKSRSKLFKFYQYEGQSLKTIYDEWLIAYQESQPQPLQQAVSEPPPLKPKTVINMAGGRRNPVTEFNQTYSPVDILLRNGYLKRGDRYLRPGSTSGVAAVQFCQQCNDGIERVYSHGGDVLNDDYSHDAFDCYRLLECDGVW